MDVRGIQTVKSFIKRLRLPKIKIEQLQTFKAASGPDWRNMKQWLYYFCKANNKKIKIKNPVRSDKNS